MESQSRLWNFATAAHDFFLQLSTTHHHHHHHHHTMDFNHQQTEGSTQHTISVVQHTTLDHDP
jgi:hypothetical protein